ncbi:MAG: hypothetical protein ACOVP1_11055 [Bacteroidia bacterium]
MKKLILIAISIISFQFVQAQSIMDKWPELKSFHSIMSQTFHPSEEGNLQPIKERSKEMMDKAIQLADSKIPLEYKTDAIVKAVEQLKTDTKKLHKMIANKASDKDITAALSALHDVFHQIVGLCKKENEQH